MGRIPLAPLEIGLEGAVGPGVVPAVAPGVCVVAGRKIERRFGVAVSPMAALADVARSAVRRTEPEFVFKNLDRRLIRMFVGVGDPSVSIEPHHVHEAALGMLLDGEH